MPQTIEDFVRSYLLNLSESQFVRQTITSGQYEAMAAFAKGAACVQIAQQLLKDRTVVVAELGMALRLKELREVSGSRFWHLEVMVDRPQRRKKRVCFVGHRFESEISSALRWNLAQVLEPYNIRLDWSGKDPTSVQILDDIVSRIKKADFCVFDTRATAGKPNVYIEAGIAYAVGTPFILFEFMDGERGASMPSDLAHAVSLRYSTYEELFREFYTALPAFAATNFS